MSQTTDQAELKKRMQGALSSLKTEFGSLRTGRASASLLEPVVVEAYGQQMPINQVGPISVPEPRTVSVQVWDKGMVSAVERAIRDAGLGLNPSADGTLVRVTIPELNEERRKELVKVAHKYAENARIAIRHVRRDGMDGLKKAEKDGDLSQDDARSQSDDVQKLTDAMIAEVDQMLATKEQEILQV